MVDLDFDRQLNGYSLTTAEILYHMPDHPSLLQTYIWQEYDVFPKFPRLKGFLEFWSTNLEGPLHRVRVAHAELMGPTHLKIVDGDLLLN